MTLTLWEEIKSNASPVILGDTVCDTCGLLIRPGVPGGRVSHGKCGECEAKAEGEFKEKRYAIRP